MGARGYHERGIPIFFSFDNTEDGVIVRGGECNIPF